MAFNPWVNFLGHAVTGSGDPRREGWIIKEGSQAIVRVAPWVEEEKRALRFSLVGFLKHRSEGIRAVESWLAYCWGKMPLRLKMLDDEAVLLQLLSEKEVEEVLLCAED